MLSRPRQYAVPQGVLILPWSQTSHLEHCRLFRTVGQFSSLSRFPDAQPGDSKAIDDTSGDIGHFGREV